jgi:hypothetical protein
MHASREVLRTPGRARLTLVTSYVPCHSMAVGTLIQLRTLELVDRVTGHSIFYTHKITLLTWQPTYTGNVILLHT